MPEMDQGIKWLVQTRPQDLLARVLPDAQFLERMPAGIAAPQLIMDTLLRMRYQGDECAMDVEAEARPEPDVGKRLYRYAMRVWIETDLPVLSVVLCHNFISARVY